MVGSTSARKWTRVASISRVLAATGEITGRTRKRADDTGLLMYELFDNGFDSDRGRAALRRINRIHQSWSIGNDEHRYVLGTFLIPPIRWIDRYGWRRTCCHERQAGYTFYRELARRMRITDVPASLADFVVWFDAYEEATFGYDKANAQLLDASRSLLAPRVHPWLRPMLMAASDALLDPPLRRALGVATPPWPVRLGVHAALRLRARRQRLAAPAAAPVFMPGQPVTSYPDGYTIDDLGPNA